MTNHECEYCDECGHKTYSFRYKKMTDRQWILLDDETIWAKDYTERTFIDPENGETKIVRMEQDNTVPSVPMPDPNTPIAVIERISTLGMLFGRNPKCHKCGKRVSAQWVSIGDRSYHSECSNG